MAEETAQKDYTQQLADLARGIQDLNTKVEVTTQKAVDIENKITPKQEEDDDDDLFAEPEISAEKIKQQVKQELSREISEAQEFKNKCDAYDAEAFKKFPDLKNKSSDFRKAVEEELKSVHPLRIDPKAGKILPPDAVLNAASRVAADWALQGKLAIPYIEEMESPNNFRRQIKGKEINEIQNDLSSFFQGMGISINKERLAERVKSAGQLSYKQNKL